MRINDLAEYEKKNAKLDKEGNVLCLYCEKELAPQNEYGVIKRCPKCEKNKESYNVMAIINEPNGRKSY